MMNSRDFSVENNNNNLTYQEETLWKTISRASAEQQSLDQRTQNSVHSQTRLARSTDTCSCARGPLADVCPFHMVSQLTQEHGELCEAHDFPPAAEIAEFNQAHLGLCSESRGRSRRVLPTQRCLTALLTRPHTCMECFGNKLATLYKTTVPDSLTARVMERNEGTRVWHKTVRNWQEHPTYCVNFESA